MMLGTMLFSVAEPVFDSVAASAAEVVSLGVFGKASEEVKVAVGPALGFNSWNDDAQVPEIPIVVKHVAPAETCP